MKKILVILIIIIVIVALFFVFKKDEAPENDKLGIADNNLAGGGSVIISEVVETKIEKLDENSNTFYHPQYRFSMIYPSDMNNTNFVEGGGEQILFQDSAGDKWFQFYITPWDEGDNLSVERIKQDLPDLVMKNTQSVILGPEQESGVGPRAVIFFGQEDGLGETREVWFVKNGRLYQITTYKRLDLFLAEILSTLTFN